MSPKPKPTGKFLKWYDANILAVLAGFLLVFIPLYPKLPLFDLLPGYIVRVRLEDFLVLLAIGVWFGQFFRGKITLHPVISRLIGVYLIIGFLSTLSALYITKTVPLEWLHIGKLYLHYFRRIEYFSLFFIFYSGIHTVKWAKRLVWLLILVLIGVAVYGYGQKYLYWPVYSTMNREFSKGWRLYLTEHARVPSTFGGHYDAAAFTMLVSLVLLSVFCLSKDKKVKWMSGLAYLGGLWLLILTASRTSFIGYLVGATLLFFLLLFIKSWTWALGRWLVVMVLSLTIMLTFGDLSERFSQLLGLNRFKEKYYALLFKPKVNLPGNINQSQLDLVTSPSDQPPATSPPSGLPADVYEAIPDQQIVVDDQGNASMVEVPRTYSENAYKYGLSAAIRLDALWPRAVNGFLTNPLLGSGYSTLTKESVGQFTEAESTDNDFLRSLGETGLLGFVAFFGIILTLMYYSLKTAFRQKDTTLQAVSFGFVAGSVALLVNAFYIDIFEASKVALVYWALAGLVMAIPRLNQSPA